MTAIPIFIGGTGSSVGKSWVATAICRYLLRLGHRVAPFKAQNMSNNSAVCPDGGEIGRAQAAQAEACGLEPHTDMNPILLKPTGALGSQVVLNGRVWKNLTAREYYDHFDSLLHEVLAAYTRLSEQHDYIVIEGAGSITELNLKHHDLVNLGLAQRINARSILVADIDRGGVFASVVGTFQLLEAGESELVRAFMVNRFRGDRTLFQDGVRILEEKTGKPCLGVFPYVSDLDLDAEDSLNLEERTGGHGRVAIVRLPHISNFTDFRLLPDAAYVSSPASEQFEVIFLPGTKSTISDMTWLRDSGMEGWLLGQAKRGARIVGVCGGYQMLGEEIMDPYGVESYVQSVRGIGLVPARTRLMPHKVTRRVTARTPSGITFSAYEIHMGVTTLTGSVIPFASLEDGASDGIRMDNIAGTYLHGALENKTVLEELLGHNLPENCFRSKEEQYDRLAGWFAENVDPQVFTSEYLLSEPQH
jgi:adenosylcobyric acid synthase